MPATPRPSISRTPADELGLDPKTYEIYKRYRDTMDDFDRVLGKSGLSMAKLERFSEQYLRENPEVAQQVERSIADQLERITRDAEKQMAAKTRTAEAPRLRPGSWLRA
jgi:hypothetical protein